MKRARIVVFGIFISLGVAFSLASNIYAADVWHNDAEKETYDNFLDMLYGKFGKSITEIFEKGNYKNQIL